MATALMSVLGLYYWDNTILDDLTVPDGMDAEIAKTEILSECSDMEIMYPNPDVFRALLKNWASHRLPIWEKLYKTTTFDYNPIHNYDRTEEWDTTTSGTNTTEQTTTNTTGNTQKTEGTDTNATTLDTTDTHNVVGFNQTSAVQASTDVQSGNPSNTETINQTITTSGTESGENNTEQNTSGTEKRTGRAYGNIGVTTTQQMIQAERDIDTFDVYDVIVADFKKRFCLGVY